MARLEQLPNEVLLNIAERLENPARLALACRLCEASILPWIYQNFSLEFPVWNLVYSDHFPTLANQNRWSSSISPLQDYRHPLISSIERLTITFKPVDDTQEAELLRWKEELQLAIRNPNLQIRELEVITSEEAILEPIRAEISRLNPAKVSIVYSGVTIREASCTAFTCQKLVSCGSVEFTKIHQLALLFVDFENFKAEKVALPNLRILQVLECINEHLFFNALGTSNEGLHLEKFCYREDCNDSAPDYLYKFIRSLKQPKILHLESNSLPKGDCISIHSSTVQSIWWNSRSCRAPDLDFLRHLERLEQVGIPFYTESVSGKPKIPVETLTKLLARKSKLDLLFFGASYWKNFDTFKTVLEPVGQVGKIVGFRRFYSSEWVGADSEQLEFNCCDFLSTLPF
jgi:hypothetical protein